MIGSLQLRYSITNPPYPILVFTPMVRLQSHIPSFIQKAVAVYSWRDFQLITVGLLHQHTSRPVDHWLPALTGFGASLHFLHVSVLVLFDSVCYATFMLPVVFQTNIYIWFVLFDLRTIWRCVFIMTSFVPLVFCPHLTSGAPLPARFTSKPWAGEVSRYRRRTNSGAVAI